ncbi:MAG TPA: SDR family oxidoreductase [Geminicoccaceae bacterium]|jgi:NAD(P)-dependent dehydrogenase (short-subunit alcohol dehydrogenase family)|nr:SDR family oxidoreductase [Geminicoccaceae bacterium]
MTEPTPVATEGAALVTGGARRIGAHLVRALAGHGYAVAIHHRASAREAAALAAQIEQEGGKAAPVQADLGDPAQLEGLVAAAQAAVGPVTVLVNNAATFVRDRATDFTLEQWDRQLAINLRAPVVLARAFARRLPAGADGLVVNLLDERIATPSRSYFSYTMSKLALTAATELLAAALAPRVRVNGIAPGLTLISGDQSEADFRRLVDRTPLGKGSSPDALAQAFAYLLQADVVTGQILFVDGGRRLAARGSGDPATHGGARESGG